MLAQSNVGIEIVSRWNYNINIEELL